MGVKEDGYASPGKSNATSTGKIDTNKELENDLEGGWDKAKDKLTDPKKNLTEEERQEISKEAERWANKVRLIKKYLDQMKKAAKNANCCVCPEWLIAIWWDERARMSEDEMSTDDTQDAFFMEASTGPFQMTGGTAVDVIKKYPGKYKAKYKNMNGDGLQDAMQEDFDLAAQLAADRICQILAGYKSKGWDPCKEGSLSAIELAGTLYSIGLGKPKNNPKANNRGKQIAEFAKEAAKMFNLPKCKCDCNDGVYTTPKTGTIKKSGSSMQKKAKKPSTVKKKQKKK